MTEPKNLRRKRLNKIEMFYIDSLCQEKSCKELADDLRLPTKLVKPRYDKALSELQKQELVEDTEEVTEQSDESKHNRVTADQFMAKNKKHGVVIMTNEASQLGDESRVRANAKKKQTTTKHISKIRTDKK